MELTSSKLRLASSVSSVDTLTKFSISKRQIAILVFMVCVAATAGFLLGFFVKGNSYNSSGCVSVGNQSSSNQQDKAMEVSEVFSKFEEKVSTEELRENLR